MLSTPFDDTTSIISVENHHFASTVFFDRVQTINVLMKFWQLTNITRVQKLWHSEEKISPQAMITNRQLVSQYPWHNERKSTIIFHLGQHSWAQPRSKYTSTAVHFGVSQKLV